MIRHESEGSLLLRIAVKMHIPYYLFHYSKRVGVTHGTGLILIQDGTRN